MSDIITSLHDLINKSFGVSTTPRVNQTASQVQITVTKITDNNPRRVALTVTNLGSNAIFISPMNDVSSSKGIYVGPNGGSVAFDWRTDMDVIAFEWYAIASSAASDVMILEEVII